MIFATLDATPSDDVPAVEERIHTSLGNGTDYSGDYRQYYRDQLEALFKLDDRFRQGKVYSITLT